jgi:hypothetical protein
MTRGLAVLLLLAACATPLPTPPALPPPNAPPVPTLHRCDTPTPPPPVPPAPRTVERLASYANAEAKARWETAERLRECRRQMDRSLGWIERLFEAAPITVQPIPDKESR